MRLHIESIYRKLHGPLKCCAWHIALFDRIFGDRLCITNTEPDLRKEPNDHNMTPGTPAWKSPPKPRENKKEVKI